MIQMVCLKLVSIGIFCTLLPGWHSILMAQELPPFNILTEDWKPYQYKENGQLKGIAVDLLVRLLDKTGSAQTRKDIKLFPWARGYQLLQNQKHTILFSTTRTRKREGLFKWVGPIFQNTTYLIGRKNQNISIRSVEDLGQYRVGTIIGDVSEEYMVNLGIPLHKLQRNVKAVYNIKKLAIGRIDLVVCGWIAFVNDAREAGIDPELYGPVFTVDIADVSYAFHHETPDWIIKRFQVALDEIKTQGVLNELFKRYGQPLPTR